MYESIFQIGTPLYYRQKACSQSVHISEVPLYISSTTASLSSPSTLPSPSFSPHLIYSIGTILVIPVAVLVDWIFQGFLLSPLAALGVVLIICGFTGFVVSEVITVRQDVLCKLPVWMTLQ